MSLNDGIKLLRIELGMSQSELANKLRVNITTVARWESGISYPRKKVADQITTLANKSNVSDLCKRQIKEGLSQGRRYGSYAKKIPYPNVEKDLLCHIVDESLDAIYVIEADTYKIVFANKQTEKLAVPDARDVSEKTCYEYLHNRKEPCEDCPLKTIQDHTFCERIIKHYADDRYLKIRGKKMKWNGKELYITYVTDITDLIGGK